MGRNEPLSLEFVQKAINNPMINETCQELHGGKCLLRALKFLGTGMERFVKLYCLYLFGIYVVIRRKNVMKNPAKEIKNFIKGFVKSLLFGGVYLGIGVYVMCLTARVFGNNGRKYFLINIEWINACAGAFGGIALMIESPQRQPEIALYICTQALKALYNMGERRNMIPDIPGGFGMLYALSMAVICYHYINNKEVLRKSYLKLIDRLLGNS